MNKKLLFTSLFVISMLLASGIGPRLTASAEGATVPTITSDLPDYAAGATVTLTGAGWAPAEAVHIFVNDDLGLTWSHNSNPDPVADGNGGFTYRFQLPTWFVATYRVTATGPNSGTATTTFTDAPPGIQNLWQCDPPTGYDPSTYTCITSSATGWVTGNDDGPFFEGETVPYRTRFQNLVPSNDYSITIEWDTTQGDKHALDYLRTYNATVTNADPCLSLTGLPASLCTTAPSTLAIPEDTFMTADPNWIANGGIQQAGEFTMFGGELTGASAYTTPVSYAGNTKTSITVDFTANSTDIVLAWGGHIAERADWGLDNAAVSISGSPYHMRILSWYDVSNSTGLNVGNTDRSLSAEAIVYPASITIIKQATPEGSTPFPFTASPSPLADFSLVDDGTTANTKLFSKIENFTTYSVTELTPLGWSLTEPMVCSVTSANGGRRAPQRR